MFQWSSAEFQNAQLAQAMTENELFPTTKEEAIAAVGLGRETASLAGIQMRMRFNPDLTAHLVTTEFMICAEDIDIIIHSANVSDHGRQLLAQSKIRL